MTPHSRIAWLLLLAAALAVALLPHAHPVLASSAPIGATPLQTPALVNPDLACAACHQSIYEHYQRTPMARGSGLALDALQPGSLHHQSSGVDYRVFARDGAAWMSFSRPAPDTLSGEHRLAYFIGSGQKGRTYLYQLEGQWFELPINFYTRRNAWDMAPAFDDAKTMPAVLPTDPNCLHCHATGVQPSLPTAHNRYADAPFRQGGVGCSACHGDPSAHLAANGHGPILNPSNFSPIQRDSACLQCHLEGDTVVYRPGHSLARFRPGENLFDSAVYFVRAGQQAGGARASSQYEALLRSACKRAAGDRLTCTTCHDPHSTPAPAERIAFFRARCLDCHTSPQIASHHPEQPDCAHCHMPTRNTADITHEQLTDHDIEAHPATHTAPRNPTDELVPVGPAHPTDADYGLAYAQLATHAGPVYQRRALDLLTAAPSLSPDAEVQLAYLRQLAGQSGPARAAYLEVLRQDPYQATALANLGVLDAASGRLPETLLVLNRLLQADPSQTAAGLNLASIQCTLGHPAEARAILDRLRLFNPDDPQLRLFSTQGVYAGRHCDLGSRSH